MTRILLDTHTLIWALDETSRLPKDVREAIQNPENEVLFSSASIWEIAIKARLGRADFGERPERIAAEAIDVGFTELPIGWRAASAVAELPLYHQDPFDRIIIAQAITAPAHLYTVDRRLAQYSELVSVFRRPAAS
jgi:PIN domain nuclease of toxin-antitoxin system